MTNKSATAKYAVDFVILPPEPVVDLVISLNKKHCNDSTIILDNDHCLPHISLLMGCLKADQLDETEALLKKIVSGHRRMMLELSNISTVDTDFGTVMALDVDVNEALQKLHESLFKTFVPLLTTDAGTADTFDGSRTNTSTLNWINNFVAQSCLEKFWPHITIGYLKEKGISEIDPVSFTASRIAICQLGNYCTCRRILAEAFLT